MQLQVLLKVTYMKQEKDNELNTVVLQESAGGGRGSRQVFAEVICQSEVRIQLKYIRVSKAVWQGVDGMEGGKGGILISMRADVK